MSVLDLELDSTRLAPDERFAVTCYGDTDIVHASYAVTGLVELANRDEIDVEFRVHDSGLAGVRSPFALWLKVAHRDGAWPVAVDCHDVTTHFCPAALAACRFYFKSNLNHETYRAAGAAYRERVRPFGPYLPCRPHDDRGLWKRWLGNARVKLAHRFVHSDRRMTLSAKVRDFLPQLNRHKRYLSRKVWSEYESPPVELPKAGPLVVFNPSCWDEAEHPSIRPLNEFRARLIVRLRELFGPRFVGGFRRYGPAWVQYPEAAEDRTISHDEYVRLLRATPLSVYVNGKWGCFSWRLPEELAASRCLVSEPIPNDSGFPLEAEAGIVIRRTPEEIADEARRLAGEPDEVRALSLRSRRTHVERLRPTERMRRLLREIRQSARDGGAVNPEKGDS
jgi:hypothetical protein